MLVAQSSAFIVNHRGTESTEEVLSFARSGDDDRAKELSPSGKFLRINVDLETVGVLLKELPPKAEALFPGRRLPAREKNTLSVSSVSLWFISLQCPPQLPVFAAGEPSALSPVSYRLGLCGPR